MKNTPTRFPNFISIAFMNEMLKYLTANENYYMVFVEMDRNEKVLENINQSLKMWKTLQDNYWEASTHRFTTESALHSEELENM